VVGQALGTNGRRATARFYWVGTFVAGMEYDAVLFDMDGVLLTGEHTPGSVYRSAIEAVLADFDVAVDADTVPASPRHPARPG
jgi:hypothetical protein